MDFDTMNITTISGIVATTMILLEVLKKICGSIGWFRKVPIFVYAIVIAGILALLANRVIIINGLPLLIGNTWVILWRSVLGAGSASGFYTWIKKSETVESATSSKDTMKIAPFILVFCFLSIGCATKPVPPLTRWAQKTIAVNTIVQEAENLQEAGIITSEQKHKALDPIVTNSQKLLHKSYKAATQGVDDTFSFDSLDYLIRTATDYLNRASKN